jgi:hypothetical protein
MSNERTHYTERTPWPGFAAAIFWGAILLSCYPLLAGWDTELRFGMRLGIVALILGAGVGVKTLLGGLTVHVQEARIVIHLGSLPLIKKVVDYGEILELESVVYAPIREFGGWGVRGFGKRKAWTARGNRAVKLTLTEGRELFVGSDHPHRLEERMRTVAGDRLSGGGSHR